MCVVTYEREDIQIILGIMLWLCDCKYFNVKFTTVKIYSNFNINYSSLFHNMDLIILVDKQSDTSLLCAE